jgi:hypothetical protein
MAGEDMKGKLTFLCARRLYFAIPRLLDIVQFDISLGKSGPD